MRIISGLYKGRRIFPPSNLQARPTTDFAKEGLFNLLDNQLDLEGTTDLDLFSGTGSIGLEFASREAISVTCIESNFNHLSFIKKTATDLGITNLHAIKGDVFKYIAACSTQFDLIFADPPYALETLPLLPDLIFQHNLLKTNGLFVLEHGKKNCFSEHPHFVQERSYGNVHFSFFR